MGARAQHGELSGCRRFAVGRYRGVCDLAMLDTGTSSAGFAGLEVIETELASSRKLVASQWAQSKRRVLASKGVLVLRPQ